MILLYAESSDNIGIGVCVLRRGVAECLVELGGSREEGEKEEGGVENTKGL